MSAASAILPAAIGQVFGHGLGNVGNELLRAGAHGLASGGINALDGGDFYKGFAIGAASSLVGSGMQAAGLDGAYLPFLTGAAGAGAAWAFGETPYMGFMQGYGIGALNHKGEKIIGDDGKEYILSFDDVVITANNPLALLSYTRSPMQSGRLSNVYPEFDLLMLGRGIFNMFKKTLVHQGGNAVLKKGFYEVNGMKFSQIYYEKLWNTGRKAPSLIAGEVLKGGAKTAVPDAFKKGFYKYVYGGWELVYNPSTKEVWHLLPL